MVILAFDERVLVGIDLKARDLGVGSSDDSSQG